MSSSTSSTSTPKPTKHALDRRRAIGLAGIGAGGLIGARLLGTRDLEAGAQTSPGPTARDRLNALGIVLAGTPSMQARVLDFLARAIEQAPELFGDATLLQARWTEAQDIWLALTSASARPDLALILGSSEAGNESEPLPLTPSALSPLSDFLSDEASVLDAWPSAAPRGLEGFEPEVEGMTRRLVSKLLAAAGLKEAAQAILRILDEAGYIWLLGQAIDERNGRLLLELVEEVLDFLLSRSFFAQLAGEVGERQARRLVGGIAGRFLPALGWTLFIAQLLWAFAEQVDLGWFRDLLAEGDPTP